MSNIIQFGAEKSGDRSAPLSNIDKMQLAVQIAAIVRASFKQPTEADVRDVLQMAASQLSVPQQPSE